LLVVYKVDRLTRSLSDFARIVEAFESPRPGIGGVSFVSVTQQFNTTTSMGRLTLNVLLSFAQFEREVTGERIRDKIAASRRKGMWMGGYVPLGYRVEDRKLVIEPKEAQIVREIFRLYRETGSISALKQEADRRGWRTKSRKSASGRRSGGAPFSRGHLYALLGNPVYARFVRHKGTLFPGQHEAIVDQEVWQTVRDRLAAGTVRQADTESDKSRPSLKENSANLLTGRIRDGEGVLLSPSHTNKKGHRYRYYVSRDLIRKGRDERDSSKTAWRFPARELEDAVRHALGTFLTDQPRLLDVLNSGDSDPRKIERALEKAGKLGRQIDRKLLEALNLDVVIKETRLALTLDRSALEQCLGLSTPGQSEEGQNDRLTIETGLTLKKRGVERKLVIGAEAPAQQRNKPDPALIRAVAKGRCWFDALLSGKVSSLADIAKQEKVTPRHIAWHLDLAFLSPKIITNILEGRQPVTLTLQSLKQTRLPIRWEDQEKMLGIL